MAIAACALVILLTQCQAAFPDTSSGSEDLGGGLVWRDGKVADVWSEGEPATFP